MTVNELIIKLEKFRLLYGNDLEVVLSVDPEGNSYSTTDAKQICCVRDGEDMLYKDVYERTKGNRVMFDKTIDKELLKHKVIGICIYPFDEGFNTPESAIKEK